MRHASSRCATLAMSAGHVCAPCLPRVARHGEVRGRVSPPPGQGWRRVGAPTRSLAQSHGVASSPEQVFGVGCAEDGEGARAFVIPMALFWRFLAASGELPEISRLFPERAGAMACRRQRCADESTAGEKDGVRRHQDRSEALERRQGRDAFVSAPAARSGRTVPERRYPRPRQQIRNGTFPAEAENRRALRTLRTGGRLRARTRLQPHERPGSRIGALTA